MDKSIFLTFLKSFFNISKFSGKVTVFASSSTSIRFETKPTESLISSTIGLSSLLSNFFEHSFNLANSFSRSSLVIIFAKILADLLIILSFSLKFSTTSHKISGALASFTSFLPSSFLQRLSTTISPLWTAAGSPDSEHF